MDVPTLLQSLANGVVFGAILALCAIGLTLVYGILNLSNFAHGDFLTFGAYGALFFGVAGWAGRDSLTLVGFAVGLLVTAAPVADRFMTRKLTRGEGLALLVFGALVLGATAFLQVFGPGGPGSTTRVLVLAALLSVAATVLLHLVLELAMWRPLRRRGATVLSLVIASLGLSLVVRNALQHYFGGDYRSLDRPNDPAPTYFGVSLSDAQLLTLAATAVLIVLVHLLLTRTRTGKAMRALADNRDLARVCGIDVDRVILYVWAVAAALVAIAGLFLSLVQNNNVSVGMGFGILIPIFAAVVLGGVGSAYGAMVGGLLVGVAMRVGPAKYDLAVAFALLIAVLVFRPQGIFGGKA
jgi:branched-chain amino acid transport system permease protein